MAVTYDNSIIQVGSSVTSLTSSAFTITANSDRVAILGLSLSNTTASGLTMSCGGQSGSQVANRAQVNEIELYGVINPSSGSQTASASWTTAADAALGAMTFYGAAQSSQFTDPQTNGGYGQSLSVSIASDSGDLTISVGAFGSTDWATDQTQIYTGSIGFANGKGDNGPGTGNTTHTWTRGSSNWSNIAGCNIEQVSGGAELIIPTIWWNQKLYRN